MSTYVIGDIQGCLEALQNLLRAIDFSPDRDQLWLCGDLINRGPDSLATLRFLYERREHVLSVLGNHDLHALAIAYGAQHARRSDTLQALMQAEDREQLFDWLMRCELAHADHAQRVLLTHAGLPPHWSAEYAVYQAGLTMQALRRDPVAFFQQMYGNEPALWRDDLSPVEAQRYTINALTRMRYVDGRGALDLRHKQALGQQPPTLLPWFASPHLQRDGWRLLFGHWASLQGHSGVADIEALDTGCVWGGRLSAYCIETRTRHTVAGWGDGANIDD